MPLFTIARTTTTDWVAGAELNHACILDGLRLSQCRRFTFRHNNLNQLDEGLKNEAAKRTDGREMFIITEALFSMDGDRSPLEHRTGRYRKKMPGGGTGTVSLSVGCGMTFVLKPRRASVNEMFLSGCATTDPDVDFVGIGGSCRSQPARTKTANRVKQICFMSKKPRRGRFKLRNDRPIAEPRRQREDEHQFPGQR